MRPTTKTNRERARAKQQHTHTDTHTHTRKVIYLQNKKWIIISAPDGEIEPTAAEQKKQCRSSPRGKRMIISFHYQHKEREGDRVQPPTKRERERVRPPSNDTHTKPFIATTKWGAEPSRVAQTPQPKAQSHASLKQKDNHHVPREKRMIISFDY